MLIFTIRRSQVRFLKNARFVLMMTVTIAITAPEFGSLAFGDVLPSTGTR